MLKKASAPVAVTFDELADRLDAEPDLHLRVERVDGSIIEVAFAWLPWVQSLRHGVVAAVGFVLIFTLGSVLMAIPVVKNRIHSGVTRWQRLYSSPEGNSP